VPRVFLLVPRPQEFTINLVHLGYTISCDEKWPAPIPVKPDKADQHSCVGEEKNSLGFVHSTSYSYPAVDPKGVII
jgi:hypothetical protein